MSIRRHSRLRLALLWGGYTVATAAMTLAVFALYALVRGEIAAQAAQAAAHEAARVQARAGDFAAEARRAIITELAGFHDDGLGRALRRWAESNALVTAVFEWEPGRGFLPAGAPTLAPALSGLADAETLPDLWSSFATWRRDQPDASAGGPDAVGPWRVRHVRTLEHADFPARALGYQAENLDVLAHAGREVDPWAGWAAHTASASAPWVIWYRAGPDAPVRGCLVEAGALLEELRREFSDTQLARVTVRAAHEGGEVGARLDDFPAHVVVAGPGELFDRKRERVQLAGVAVALLLGVFAVGAALLLVYSRREARDAERKTTFVSQVSHELRTPLTSIRMFADMLATPDLPEEKRRKFAATISRESVRLGGLIERLLAFNALERGRASVSRGPVDVAAVVRETLEAIEGMLGEAGLRVVAVLPEGEVMASSDRSVIKQALLNLLDNAAKYAGAGGDVRVSLESDDAGVRLRVADRGPGIPAGQRERIFEPFVQGGSGALTEKAPGVGLGLSIARGMLRAAGGDLVLATAERGATFEIRLPRLSPT